MDSITPQQQEEIFATPPQQKHFFNKKFIITVVVLALLGGGIYGYFWLWQNTLASQENSPVFTSRPDAADQTPEATGICTQGLTKAEDPNTGEIKAFSSSCAVPAGWTVIQG